VSRKGRVVDVAEVEGFTPLILRPPRGWGPDRAHRGAPSGAHRRIRRRLPGGRMDPGAGGLHLVLAAKCFAQCSL